MKRDATRLTTVQESGLPVTFTKRTLSPEKHQGLGRPLTQGPRSGLPVAPLERTVGSETLEGPQFPSPRAPQPTPIPSSSATVASHPNQINNPLLVQQHPRYTKCAVESKEPSSPEKSQKGKLHSPIPVWRTSLMPQPNCVTVSTRPCGRSAT